MREKKNKRRKTRGNSFRKEKKEKQKTVKWHEWLAKGRRDYWNSVTREGWHDIHHQLNCMDTCHKKRSLRSKEGACATSAQQTIPLCVNFGTTCQSPLCRHNVHRRFCFLHFQIGDGRQRAPPRHYGRLIWRRLFTKTVLIVSAHKQFNPIFFFLAIMVCRFCVLRLLSSWNSIKINHVSYFKSKINVINNFPSKFFFLIFASLTWIILTWINN